MAKEKNEETKRHPIEGLVDIPDIPMPEEPSGDEEIKDECKVAFKWAFVGAGQGGSRIVQSLYQLGYRRVCAINTTVQDLKDIKIPEENKLIMDIGEGGSAKNPEKGAEAIKKYYEDVYDLMRRSFGDDFERIMVVGCGGGGCVQEGTKIFVDKYGFIEIEKFWEIIKNDYHKDVTPIFDLLSKDRIFEISSLGFKTYGFNEDNCKTELNLIKNIREVEVNQDCRTKIVLDNESETIVSDWHPYYILDIIDGLPSVVERKAIDLKIEDLVFVPNIKSDVDLNFDRCKKISWISGIIAGDGHFCDSYMVDITSMDDEIIERCKKFSLDCFSFGEKCKKFNLIDKEKNKSKRLRIYNKELVKEISSIIGGLKTNKTHDWSINDFIVSNIEVGNSFLAGLWDSDGFCKGRNFGIALANEKAIDQICCMLSIRGIKFHKRKRIPKNKNWSAMYEIKINIGCKEKFKKSVGKYMVCKRKVDDLNNFSNYEGWYVKGFKFKYIKKVFDILRLKKSTSLENSNFFDEDGNISIGYWIIHNKSLEARTIYRLIKFLRIRYEELKNLDFKKLSNEELCKISGLKKETIKQIFNFGSFKTDKLWRYNECDEKTREELEKLAKNHIESRDFKRIPFVLELIENNIECISSVLKVEKVGGEKRFFDLTIENCNSYCATNNHSLCFTHNTGGGSCGTLVKIAHDIAQSFKLEIREQNEVIQNVSVGCLVSLPSSSEGPKVNANGVKLLDSLFAMVGNDKGKLAQRSLSPLIIVDNERINKIYPNLPVTKFWSVANQSITSLFHLFNNIAIQDSEFTTFDRAELKDILSSGVISFGACQIKKWENPTDISFAIRDNLTKNILVSGLDLRAAKKAACIFIGHPEVLDSIPQGYLEHGFEMLSRIMQENSTVHRGIYKGNIVDAAGNPGLRVYTILGELGRPEDRMKEMERIGGVNQLRR